MIRPNITAREPIWTQPTNKRIWRATNKFFWVVWAITVWATDEFDSRQRAQVQSDWMARARRWYLNPPCCIFLMREAIWEGQKLKTNLILLLLHCIVATAEQMINCAPSAIATHITSCCSTLHLIHQYFCGMNDKLTIGITAQESPNKQKWGATEKKLGDHSASNRWLWQKLTIRNDITFLIRFLFVFRGVLQPLWFTRARTLTHTRPKLGSIECLMKCFN